MKRTLITTAVLLAAALLPAQTPVAADSAPAHTYTKIQYGPAAWDCMYRDEVTGIWYSSDGEALCSHTPAEIEEKYGGLHRHAGPQTVGLYQGTEYEVDLAAMQVRAPDGTVNAELTAVLPDYLAFRPLSITCLNGQFFDDLAAEQGYEAAAARFTELARSIPLEYSWIANTENFYCEISLGSQVIGGVEYAEDVGDDLGARPWQLSEDGFSAETGITDPDFTENAHTECREETTAPPEETTLAPVATKRGDVDCNGDINIADAILLARFNAEDQSEEARVTAQGKANADTNHDGSVKADDLAFLLSYLADLEPSL